MNRRFLTGLLISVFLSLIVNECYAWPEPPDIFIWDWILYTTVGESVDVIADVESGGPIYYWDWDWPGALNGTYDEYSYSSTATVWSNTPGQYTVDVEGEDEYGQYDSDYAYVYVIDVEIDTPSSFPAYVELGNDLALGCTSYGATGGSYSWTKVTGPGNVTFTPSASAEDPDFSANQSGNYTVKVEYTKEEATASDTLGTITVVEVTQVTSDKGSAVLCENITFTVTTNPSGHENLVTWSGGGNPASQNGGATFTTCWPCIGGKTVTATCGDSSKSKNVTISLPNDCTTGSKGAIFALTKTSISSAACKEKEDEACGLMDNPENFSYTINARYDQCKWVFDVEASAEAPTGACSSNYINVEKGNESGITEDNYEMIVYGFRDLDGCVRISGAGTYANYTCTTQHEDNHFEQFVEQLELQRVAFLTKPCMSDMPIVCGDSSTETCQNAKAARFTAIYIDMMSAYAAAYGNAHDEVRAEAAARECNQGIADIIEAYWE